MTKFVCSFSDSVHVHSMRVSAYGSVVENSLATSYFDLGRNAGVCFIAADFPPSDAVSHFAFLTPCLATYQLSQ